MSHGELIVRQQGKAPALTQDVLAMLSHVTGCLLGQRDRALLLVGFAGAFRRSELVVLEVEDLELTDDGMKVLIRRSKTEQVYAGETVVRPVAASDHCRPSTARCCHGNRFGSSWRMKPGADKTIMAGLLINELLIRPAT